MSKIFREKRKHTYVTIDKTCLNDHCLSLKAKGLHTYVMGLPDDWDVYVKDLINRHEDGRDSILSALKQLERFGYLRREMKRAKNGQSQGCDYFFFETPQNNPNPNGGIDNKEFEPKPDFPLTENPLTVNQHLINNNYKQLMNSSKQYSGTFQEDIARDQQKSVEVAAANFENEFENTNIDCQSNAPIAEQTSNTVAKQPETEQQGISHIEAALQKANASVAAADVNVDIAKPIGCEPVVDQTASIATENLSDSLGCRKPVTKTLPEHVGTAACDDGPNVMAHDTAKVQDGANGQATRPGPNAQSMPVTNEKATQLNLGQNKPMAKKTSQTSGQ